MISRRHILNGLGAVALSACAYAFGAYRATMAGAEAQISGCSDLVQSRAGALEYAAAGRGAPLLMIHGTGLNEKVYTAPLISAI
jgi:hypothetical protein